MTESPVKVRLDRVIVSSEAPRDSAQPRIDGYKVLKDCCIQPQNPFRTYDRARITRSLTSGTQISWQYGRRRAWLQPWRITVVAGETRGLVREDVLRVLEHCRDYKLLVVELAVDFSPGTKVNRVFVNRHAVFGKSQRRFDRGGPEQLRYGTRRSGKLIRCYRKEPVRAYRVEVESHRPLLRARHITQLEDLPKLAELIFPQHLKFVRLSWSRIRRQLSGRHGSQAAEEIVLEARRRAQTSLNSTTRYLRRKGVNNVHRFFCFLSINRIVKTALRDWARNF